MKRAFTLAEILITISVIGVVAAITLPTLMNNIGDKKWEAQRAKAMNVIANGYKKMMADEGVFEISNLEMMNCTTVDCLISYHKNYFKILDTSTDGKNLPEEYSIPKEYQSQAGRNVSQFSWSDEFSTVTSNSSNTYDPLFSFITPDGMGFGFYGIASGESGNKAFVVATDVNSMQKVNSVNKDLYMFSVSQNGVVTDITDELLNNTSICSSTNLSACKTRMSCRGAGGQWFESSPPPGHGGGGYNGWYGETHGRCM